MRENKKNKGGGGGGGIMLDFSQQKQLFSVKELTELSRCKRNITPATHYVPRDVNVTFSFFLKSGTGLVLKAEYLMSKNSHFPDREKKYSNMMLISRMYSD